MTPHAECRGPDGFLGGRLNIVHNCLDRHIRDGLGNKVALVWEGDDGGSRRCSYGELHGMVADLAAAMRMAGVKEGDIVGLCMPISIEAVAVMFAALKIDAACMQIAARSAPQEMATSLQHGSARLLFINDGYPRAGKRFDLGATARTVLKEVPTLRLVVVLQRMGDAPAAEWAGRGEDEKRLIGWRTFQESGRSAPEPATAVLDSDTQPLSCSVPARSENRRRLSIPMQGRLRRSSRRSGMPSIAALMTPSIGLPT